MMNELTSVLNKYGYKISDNIVSAGELAKVVFAVENGTLLRSKVKVVLDSFVLERHNIILNCVEELKLL